MKIALCFSGQPRTWRKCISNILEYFSEQDIDTFFHLYDFNSWKNPNTNTCVTEQVSEQEQQDIIQILNPKKYKFDANMNFEKHKSWANFLYGVMIANHLKRQHEIENDFEYDIVYKIRTDLIFPPNKKFITKPIVPLSVYMPVHLTRLHCEFNAINFSDVIFWGDSRTMDLISDAYRYYDKELHHDINGPHTIFYKYICRMNIIPVEPEEVVNETVVRKQARFLNPKTQYHMIREIYMNWNKYSK